MLKKFFIIKINSTFAKNWQLDITFLGNLMEEFTFLDTLKNHKKTTINLRDWHVSKIGL